MDDLPPSPVSHPAQASPRPAGSYYDNRFGAHAVKVLPGECQVTDDEVMLVTVLGSCVSACVSDPMLGIGGMNHFMLPEGADDPGSSWASASARYGSFAMELLINELLKRGAARRRLQAKVFGGGAVLAGFTASNVGQRNGEFVLQYLKAEGIQLTAQDLFDTCPRRVHYFPRSGRAMVKRLASANDREVLASEKLYRSRVTVAAQPGSVELF